MRAALLDPDFRSSGPSLTRGLCSMRRVHLWRTSGRTKTRLPWYAHMNSSTLRSEKAKRGEDRVTRRSTCGGSSMLLVMLHVFRVAHAIGEVTREAKHHQTLTDYLSKQRVTASGVSNLADPAANLTFSMATRKSRVCWNHGAPTNYGTHQGQKRYGQLLRSCRRRLRRRSVV